MYRKLIYIRDVHIISKILGFLFFTLSFLVMKINPLFLLFIAFFFFMFNNLKVLLTSLLLFIVSYFSGFFFFVFKLFLFCQALFIFLNIIDKEEIRYFVEILFYKKHTEKWCYSILKFYYFWYYFYDNIKDFIQVYKMHGKKFDMKKYCFIFRKAFNKGKRDVSKVMEAYRYRFYHIQTDRTYMEENEIGSLDMKYVLLNVILLFLMFVYGR